MLENENFRLYKDRIRIFFILYFFSEDYMNPTEPHLVKVFNSEVRIQKIDFLIRNPDYLAYELLLFAKEGKFSRTEIKLIVKDIFAKKEPVIRRLEMEKFFFGAYEDIDDVIGFLKSIGFIEFKSEKNINLKTINKCYYITNLACEKVNMDLNKLQTLEWYIKRCELINNYFGDLSGSQLKALQYEIDEYRNTSYKEYINDIQDQVKKLFLDIFGEEL